jgi:hypothetical protein
MPRAMPTAATCYDAHRQHATFAGARFQTCADLGVDRSSGRSLARHVPQTPEVIGPRPQRPLMSPIRTTAGGLPDRPGMHMGPASDGL